MSEDWEHKCKMAWDANTEMSKELSTVKRTIFEMVQEREGWENPTDEESAYKNALIGIIEEMCWEDDYRMFADNDLLV